MQAAQSGRIVNPNLAAQFFEELEDTAKRYCNYDGWGFADGDWAQPYQGDVTISPPNETAPQAHRMFGRSVWSKEAPEAGAGRSYQFFVEVIFISERLGG